MIYKAVASNHIARLSPTVVSTSLKPVVTQDGLITADVVTHEIGHWVQSNNAFGSAFMDAARSVGVDPWDTLNLPFGQFNMDEAFADSFASYYTDGDVKRRYPKWTQLVEAVISGGRTATLSDSEREDREDEAQVRQSPKLKPPRTASWMKVKRFFPGVRNPVFHATTGPRAASIAMRGEGIKSNSGFTNFGAGNMGSISLSRDLNFLLKGGFGNVIFVLDRDELNRKFPVNPHAYLNWEDEYEERVFTDKIPPSMIRGVILRYKPLGFELDEWESKVGYPVAYIDGREWGSRTATLSDSEREDREDEAQVRQSPKLKPPRCP